LFSELSIGRNIKCTYIEESNIKDHMFKGTTFDGDQMDWGPTKYGEQLQRDSEKYYTQDPSQSSIAMSNS
jgi:hypothetical protein